MGPFFSTRISSDSEPDHIRAGDYRGNVSCTCARSTTSRSSTRDALLTFGGSTAPVSVARSFNTTALPPLEDFRVLPDFRRDVLAGRPIVLLPTLAAPHLLLVADGSWVLRDPRRGRRSRRTTPRDAGGPMAARDA